jgi:hypothetical protein
VPVGTTEHRRTRWQQTPLGRIGIGVVLAQGLFYGLRQLLTGVLMAVWGPEAAAEIWASQQGVVLIQGVQVFSLLVSGLLTGGGQRHGFLLGGIVGVWTGVLAGLLKQNPAPVHSAIALYGQPMLSGVIGALAGWFGALVWKPLPLAQHPGLPMIARKARKPAKSIWHGEIAWLRVLLGAALAVAGTLFAAFVFDKLLELGAGQIGTTDDIQDKLITWEIKALAVLAGGALAGASTSNGLKQGILVGLLCSFALIALEPRLARHWVQASGLILLSSFTLAIVGGWFGGQLFPPVIKNKPARGTLGSLTGP